MKRISIKTTDGNRNEYLFDDDFDVEDILIKGNAVGFIKLKTELNGYKIYNTNNIVSITVTEIDN